MVTELTAEELSKASAENDHFKTNNVWAFSMTFFKILNPD